MENMFSPSVFHISVNIVLHAMFWWCIQLCITPVFFENYVPVYTRLSIGKQKEWNIKATVMLFSVYSVFFSCIALLTNEQVYHQDLYVNTPYTQFLMDSFAGHFLWDLFVCIFYFDVWGYAFVIHGLFCSMMYMTLAYSHLGVAFGLRVIFYECSNVFMNTRVFMKDLKMFDSPLWNVVNIGFAISFISVRLLYGCYLTICIVCAVWYSNVPVWFKYSVYINSVLSYGLNMYWGKLLWDAIVKYNFQ